MTDQSKLKPGRRPALLPNPLVVRVAIEVISHASRERPADAVLREALRSRRVPSIEETREISRAVFAYYRWFGWLDHQRALPGQIKSALELAQAFAERPQSFSDEKLVERSVPAWVREEMEVSPVWVRAIQPEPKLWLRARRGQGRALAEKLGTTWKSPLPDAVLYQGKEDLFRRPEFHAGEFEIQDISSQAVGWLCDPRSGETWWDTCAGEGGKTLHLSDLMENKGLIRASDRAAWRLQKLRRRAGRAKVFNYRTAVWDGSPKLPTKTQFDGVLVDAPCSGIGTWQRNPHARWTTTLADVKELAQLQKRILAHVGPAVKPGGRLIYSVCTLTRAETVEVVRGFEKTHAEFEPLPLPHLAFPDDNGCALPSAAVVRIWPQQSGGGGMFVAAWRRQPKAS